MIIYKVYKFRLYPDSITKTKLKQNIGSSLFVFNYYLNKKDTIYYELNKNWSLKDMKANLVGLQAKYKWLGEVAFVL